MKSIICRVVVIALVVSSLGGFKANAQDVSDNERERAYIILDLSYGGIKTVSDSAVFFSIYDFENYLEEFNVHHLFTRNYDESFFEGHFLVLLHLGLSSTVISVVLEDLIIHDQEGMIEIKLSLLRSSPFAVPDINSRIVVVEAEKSLLDINGSITVSMLEKAMVV